MLKPVVLHPLSLAAKQQLRQKGWRYFMLVIAMQFVFVLLAVLLQLV